MALSSVRLAGTIKSAFVAAGAADNAATTAMANALALAIVNEVKEAVVTPTLLVAPPGGGPVTGTGTLT